jgi:hypothetical protein
VKPFIEEASASNSTRTLDEVTALSPVELARIVPISEAVRLSGISEDGWRRHHRGKLVRLSPRRVGVRLRDALLLSEKA